MKVLSEAEGPVASEPSRAGNGMLCRNQDVERDTGNFAESHEGQARGNTRVGE